jgi:hypothetical protein
MQSEEFTRAVLVKRNTKKNSGYTVSEEDGEYFVGAVPDKARVNIGDKIVGINGIRAEDFEDEEDANALINSIRLVVVPADKIEEYEAAKALTESGGIAPTNGNRVRILDYWRMIVSYLWPSQFCADWSSSSLVRVFTVPIAITTTTTFR